MADLTTDFCGIKSPNPYWLASAPPTNTGLQVSRAFEMGWGGAVWKTLGEPIVNVSSRLAAMDHGDRRMAGLNNIELITDRPLDVNFAEIREVKKRFPDNAVIVSLMVETREEWAEIIRRSEDTGADGLELNFGCPHGMCERGMGSAVGQEPAVLEELVSWVMEYASIPVIAKLTPNIADIRDPAFAAQRGGANAVSLINTIQSLMGVDLDRMVPLPRVGEHSTHGGFCGPAVKPIALRMAAMLGREETFKLPISGIGGIGTWRDAAEFISLGSTSVQVCTAVMHHGFRIIEDLTDGLSNYLDGRGLASVNDLRGLALPAFREWKELDLNYHHVAEINPDTCIGCQVCVVACHDASHQCIHPPGTPVIKGHEAPLASLVATNAQASPEADPYRVPYVDETDCVGCNLCLLVCPVDGCITMREDRHAPHAESWSDRTSGGG